MRITPKEDECFRHLDSKCGICPYYDYVVTTEHNVYRGKFWMGQLIDLNWGTFGDGMTLTPRQYGMKLN